LISGFAAIGLFRRAIPFLGKLGRFLVYPQVYFLPVDYDVQRRIYPQADLLSFDINNSHPDSVANADFLPNPAGKNQHRIPSPICPQGIVTVFLGNLADSGIK